MFQAYFLLFCTYNSHSFHTILTFALNRYHMVSFNFTIQMYDTAMLYYQLTYAKF